jgi:hypothetical protein
VKKQKAWRWHLEDAFEGGSRYGYDKWPREARQTVDDAHTLGYVSAVLFFVRTRGTAADHSMLVEVTREAEKAARRLRRFAEKRARQQEAE